MFRSDWRHSAFSATPNKRIARRRAPKKQNIRFSERGFVLLPVIALLTIIAAVTFVLNRENASGLAVSEREAEANAASYVAEAGLRHAIWQASAGGACTGYKDLADFPFGKHAYSVAYSKASGSPIDITTTGTLASGAARTLVATGAPVYQATESVTVQQAKNVRDAHIYEGSPTGKRGSWAFLRVTGAYGGLIQEDKEVIEEEEVILEIPERRALLRFELGAIPQNVTVISATLELNLMSSQGKPTPVQVHRIVQQWDDDFVTWQRREFQTPWLLPGGDFSPVPGATGTIGTTTGVYHPVDVTALVADWVKGASPNFGMAIVSLDPFADTFLHSSESDVFHERPKLTVQYACECGKTCEAGEVGENSCDADFEAGSVAFDFDWSVDNNKITGIDFLPENTIVDGATLPAGGGWIMADDGENALFVTDADGAALTSFPVSFGDARGIAYVEGGKWANHLAVADKGDDRIYFLDLDGKVQSSIFVQFIAEEPHGLTYIGETSSGAYLDHLAFVSKKNGPGEIYIVDQDGVLQKTINVDAHAPVPQGVAHLPEADKFLVTDLNGAVSIVDFNGTLLQQYPASTWALKKLHGSTIHPETCEHILVDPDFKAVHGLSPLDTNGSGGAKLLMVVSNDSNLTEQEQAKKTLIESWSYVTQLISDNAKANDYNTAIDANDVVFIGEDASSGQVEGKLVDAPIGVITEEANQATELGLSTSIGWGFGSTIRIDDNAHYITRPFAEGPLQVLGNDDSLAYLSGVLSPDVRILGSTTSGPMLTTLEAAAATTSAAPAAGRRALLPWSGSDFQLSNLNKDGKTVFRRALAWGVQQPPRCDADYAANNVVAEFPWMPGTNTLSGIDYLPEGLVVDGHTIPAGGGWIMSDSGEDRLFATAIGGAELTDFPIKPGDIQGVALVEGGFWRHRLALVDKTLDRLFYLDLDGNIEWSFDVSGITESPLGLGFIGATASAVYDDMLVISSDKDPSGGGTATLYIVDQWGVVFKTIDVEAFAPTPQGVTHVTGADKLIVADKSGTVSVVDFDGNLVHQYSGLSLGVEELKGISVNPTNCEHRLVNKKPVENVVSVNRVTGSGSRYIETYMPWSVATPDTWETVNFEIYGIEPDSVLEFAIINTDGKPLWGGARTAGSSLERRMLMHENSGGQEIMTMHVQSDSLGRVELYADKDDKITFLLLGYWPEARYVENMQYFKAGVSESYTTHALSGYGVAANDVAEILMVNNSLIDKRKAGARIVGAIDKREVTLHAAESGGGEMVSFMTVAGADANANIEVYAHVDNDIDFYLLGHWSTPPGTYTEAFDGAGRATVNKVWKDINLNAFGVPANAVAQLVMSNRQNDNSGDLGIRSKGSQLARILKPHKPFPSGDEVATMHVNVDAANVIQVYEEDVLRNHRFYLLGWWVLN